MQDGFDAIRRADRALTEAEARAFLDKAAWGTLSLCPDENGYPHAVPINCAYLGGALYFHCAYEGKKLRALERDNRACFSAAALHELSLSKFTSYYESVLCYGRVTRVPEPEKTEALVRFTAHVFSVPEAGIRAKVEQCAAPTLMLRMEIDRITGKRNSGH